MSTEPRHRVYRKTLSEWIALGPGSLDIDATALFHFIPTGERDFGLNGAELEDFVRRYIAALLDAGAIPVKSGKGTACDWVPSRQYGTEKGEIIDNVVKAWHSIGNDPIELAWLGIWFARPDPKRPRFVKMD